MLRSRLLVAANKGHLDTVRLLLAHGAEVNRANCNENAPLWVASWKGHLEVVKLLLKANAQCNKMNHNMESPVWVACEQGHLEVSQVLIEARANLDLPAHNEISPLWVASWKGHVEVVQLLLKARANQDKQDRHDTSPLWVASKRGHVEVVRALLKASADPAKLNCEKRSPLYVASYWGHVKVLPTHPGKVAALLLIASTKADHLALGRFGTYAGRFTPTLPGIYKLQVEQSVPGIFAEYWWHRNIHRNAPQQPDITRIDHVLDFWFPDVTFAPAFVRWKFILHFECIRTARWPYNFGHALGIIASPGSEVRAFFWNDGSVTKRVPEDVVPQKREQMIREDCMTEVPYFICIDLLFHDPVVDPFGFYAFEIEWSTPMAEDLEEKLSTSIEIMLYHQNDTDYWGWWPIQQGCLLSSGLNIQGSPFEDFQAISGSARAEFSTVLAMPDSTTEMTVIVDTLAEVRVDLRDILGQPVVGGSMLGSVSARLFTMKGVKEMDLPVRWDPARGFYAASWTPLPPDPIFQDDVSTGRYYRQLIVRLDGNQIINSPMPVTILLAISDPSQSFVMAGDYTIAKAGEPVWYQVRSATLAGRLRVTGGDVYEVLFEGPAHDPLMGDDRFDGTVIDNLNGSYTVNFEIQRPGYYNMRVFLNTVEIGPSPFLGVLIWDDLSAPLTTAFGPGISPAQNVPGNPARIIAGVNTSFDISAKDSYDVQYFRGGGMFRLSTPVMDMGPGVNVTFDSGFTSPEDYSFITDNNDGSYSVEYRLCQAGLTAMTIELYTTEAWRPIGSSPFLLQVLRGELVAETSKVHPPISQVFSGVPNTMQVDLRDACGNNANDEAMQSLYISLERIENGTQEALVFEAVRSTPGEVTVFFTPMQRGEHRLVVLGDGVPVQRAPMYFTVMPATSVPDSRNWLLPAIGASTQSTFEILNSPCHAGDFATIKVTARDMWGDPLVHGHYAFMIYFWREMEGFDADSLRCQPLCEGPAAQATRLVVPDARVTLRSVQAEVYEFSLMSNVSGNYHGAVSVLRPGAFYGVWYNNLNHSKRVFTEMLRGPLELDWGIHGPGGTLPSNKFSLQILGWLRIPASDRYTFQLNSDTGGRVFLNGTEISPSGSSGIDRGNSAVDMAAELQQGFVPIEILYDHWMGETTRNIPAFLSFGFGSNTVPFHILQAEDMYYEEMLHQPYNPFMHVVNPAIDVHSLEVVGGLRNNALHGVVGKDVFLRLQSADRYGNLQTRRDPASYLHLRSDPPDVAGRRSSDMLSSRHWRIEPLQSGAWDVVLIPEGPAPQAHNLTFELYSQSSELFGGLRPVATTSLLLHLSVNLPVAETSSLLCVPPPPWPVGVEVTCSLVPRDVQGNEIQGGLWPVMSFYAELQQRQDATELLETVRWYVDAAAANYRSLNRQLRHGGRLQKAALGHRQRLDQLAKIAPPLLEPLTLWRGFSSLSFVSYLHHLQKVEDDEDGSQSKDVKDDAYMSCSLSHSIGNFYARRHAILPEDLDDAVLLRIQVPAVCVACCSGLDHEEEILLPRGSVLRIDRIDQLDHKNGPANGQVTAILTAEATLLAGAGANTSLDSRKSLRRVSLYALPPDSAEELTTTLHVADPLDRCDRRERCGV
ncbi:Ankyrin repeat and KH domain-containing protein mask (Multiple ankyrin repeat single KH domain-containing protein) [Durusdinium trenchii]|uniref:Ankyrin repeat and KH domain-containing protein mask (Multiple ankyrin repeat single KH domain-containing protein) n=1 Tax=Durusdinium trenchii TaxID=1381693 RepID=A0ABP0M2P3_9DINO